MRRRLRRGIAFLRLQTRPDDNGIVRGAEGQILAFRGSLKMAAHKNRQTSDHGACLYVCMKFNVILKRAVKVVISLADTCLTRIYLASADAEFGADFRLYHSVHVAVQDCKFQCGEL